MDDLLQDFAEPLSFVNSTSPVGAVWSSWKLEAFYRQFIPDHHAFSKRITLMSY
jgi:hypothetical protein